MRSKRMGAALIVVIALLSGCGNGVVGTITLDPSSVHLSPKATQVFSVTVTQCKDTAVAWSVDEGSAGGDVTNTGVYTAPDTAGTYHVVATCRDDRNVYGTATVSVE